MLFIVLEYSIKILIVTDDFGGVIFDEEKSGSAPPFFKSLLLVRFHIVLVHHDGVVPFLLHFQAIKKSSHFFSVELQFFVVVLLVGFKIVDEGDVEVL